VRHAARPQQFVFLRLLEAKGDDVIIAGSVSDEAAKQQYPDGRESPKPYIRIVPYPSS
jgi:hypothetical protein